MNSWYSVLLLFLCVLFAAKASVQSTALTPRHIIIKMNLQASNRYYLTSTTALKLTSPNPCSNLTSHQQMHRENWVLFFDLQIYVIFLSPVLANTSSFKYVPPIYMAILTALYSHTLFIKPTIML